jgi:hypothetical protein
MAPTTAAVAIVEHVGGRAQGLGGALHPEHPSPPIDLIVLGHFDRAPRRLVPDHRVGDPTSAFRRRVGPLFLMFEAGVDAVWNGSAYERFRAHLDSDEPPDICRSCSVYRGSF